MRMRTKWHNKERQVSVEEKANTMAFISWRIAMAMVLNLENENFQTDTQKQRMDIIQEVVAFLVSITDRLVAQQMTQEAVSVITQTRRVRAQKFACLIFTVFRQPAGEGV